MLNLTPLGFIHTFISLVALVAVLIAVLGEGRISSERRAGRIYLLFTGLTALTGFGLFPHGRLGAGHVLGGVTLVALLIGWGAERRGWTGRAAPYVTVLAYGLTLYLQLIAGVNETFTRIPPDAPLFSSAGSPASKATQLGLLVAFLAGLAMQLVRERNRGREVAASLRSGQPGR